MDNKAKSKTEKLAAADIAECAVFVALMIAGAFIKVPFPFMPLTFQTVFAVLAGLLLGWKKGIISTSAYAFIGLMGIPVFTNGGGIFYVTVPSFGYVLGFIASAGIAGIEIKYRKLWRIILLSAVAFLADYVVGVTYFIAVWRLGGYSGLWQAVITYNLVYIPKDAVLCLLAAILSHTVSPYVKSLRKRHKDKADTEKENTER